MSTPSRGVTGIPFEERPTSHRSDVADPAPGLLLRPRPANDRGIALKYLGKRKHEEFLEDPFYAGYPTPFAWNNRGPVAPLHQLCDLAKSTAPPNFFPPVSANATRNKIFRPLTPLNVKDYQAKLARGDLHLPYVVLPLEIRKDTRDRDTPAAASSNNKTPLKTYLWIYRPILTTTSTTTVTTTTAAPKKDLRSLNPNAGKWKCSECWVWNDLSLAGLSCGSRRVA